MSANNYINKISSIDNQITRLEKRKVESDNRAVKYDNLANKIVIRSTDSTTSIKNKMKRIDEKNKKADKQRKKSADLARQINSLRNKRNKANKSLNRIETKTSNDLAKEARQIRKQYESQIITLQEQFTNKEVNIINKTQKNNNISIEYDVFISHAWEDKQDFVDDFVNELSNIGIKVWYDSQSIKWGDSLRETIDEGLKNSKFGIVILSKHFINEEKYWPKTELNALFQKETINDKVILPIWHGITKQEIMNYSTILADKNAMNTSSFTPKELSREVKQLLESLEA